MRRNVAASVCRSSRLSCRWEYFDQVSPSSIPAMYHNQPVGRTAPGALRCILGYAVVAYSVRSNAYSVHWGAYSPALLCCLCIPSAQQCILTVHQKAYSLHCCILMSLINSFQYTDAAWFSMYCSPPNV